MYICKFKCFNIISSFFDKYRSICSRITVIDRLVCLVDSTLGISIRYIKMILKHIKWFFSLMARNLSRSILSLSIFLLCSSKSSCWTLLSSKFLIFISIANSLLRISQRVFSKVAAIITRSIFVLASSLSPGSSFLFSSLIASCTS
jgi:hypothetical protein